MAADAVTATVAAGSLMIVYFIEQQLEGWTFEINQWPLHITLAPWFRVSDEEAVARSLERLAPRVPAFRLQVGGIEYFGVRKNIPVNIIVNQQPLKILHNDLLEDLKEADIAAHEQPFIRQEYMAHITRRQRDGKFCNQGEQITVSNFQLVRLREDGLCEAMRLFTLKQK